jgi:hypothetical protein
VSRLDAFLALSAELTAFSVFELRGTGQAEEYLATADQIVGAATVDELLARHAGIGTDREDGIRKDILSDPKLGAVARNVIKLWYVGVWYELPTGWAERYGASEADVTFTPSPAAYTEALLWPAVGANPPGAKAPGYGSWALPPRIPAFDGDAG